jgi:AbrB family looped-hinge helix DNA binding protein
VKTILSAKGQIVLPAELRQKDNIRPGEKFEIERVEAGQYLIKRSTAPKNVGLVDLLLACPQKGWFEPIASESTDSL